VSGYATTVARRHLIFSMFWNGNGIAAATLPEVLGSDQCKSAMEEKKKRKGN